MTEKGMSVIEGRLKLNFDITQYFKDLAVLNDKGGANDQMYGVLVTQLIANVEQVSTLEKELETCRIDQSCHQKRPKDAGTSCNSNTAALPPKMTSLQAMSSK